MTKSVVRQMGTKAAERVASSVGSGPIYGAAAINHVSKLLRGNVVTAIATTAILSSVDFVRMFQGRMSGAQVFKNVTVTASAVAGGTVGWLVGVAITGGFGGGLLGSLGGGALASNASKSVLDKFIEDDAKEMLRIVEDVFSNLSEEYLLTEKEAKAVLEDFRKRDVPDTLRDMYVADDRNGYALDVLKPLVEKHVKARKRVALPSIGDMSKETGLVLQELTRARLQQLIGAEETIDSLLEAPRISLWGWYKLVKQCQTPTDAEDLRDLCIHALKTYPDHPGLLLARAAFEAMSPDHDVAVSSQGIGNAIRLSVVDFRLGPMEVEKVIEHMIGLALARAPGLGISLILALLELDESNADLSFAVDRGLASAGKFDDDRVRAAATVRRVQRLTGALELAVTRLNRQYETENVLHSLGRVA